MTRDAEVPRSGYLADVDPSRLASQLDSAFENVGVPGKIWVSSVASDAATNALLGWFSRRWSIDANLVEPASEACGVTNAYAEPGSLGSDRWAALIAIRHRYEQPATIVDCGTAVTIDFLYQNRFCGGVILPGLETSRKSLFASTANLNADTPGSESCLATSTSSGIHSGVLFGLAGAIDRLIALQQAELGTASTIYLTGGDASQIHTYLSLDSLVVEDLVLQGIEILSELNV